MTIAERAKKIANAKADVNDEGMYYGSSYLNTWIDLLENGETLRLFFTDTEYWGDGDGDDYYEDAVDKAGNRYTISYIAPDLEREEGECDSDFYDRRAWFIDWSEPCLIEDYDTGELLYDEGDPHGVTVRWFDE